MRNNSLIDLSDRVAVITGSTRGIGLAIAEKFAAHGASLVINGVSNRERLNDVASELSSRHGVKVETVFGSVNSSDVAGQLAKVAFKSFRRADILVNNAGILKDSLIGMIPQEQIDDTLDINVKGVIYCTQAFSRLMGRNETSSIINMASIIGRFGNRGQMVYGASKAAVIGATYSASKELAANNIRVNAIAPGYINTDMIKDIPSDIHEERMSSIAMNRVGEAEDIANTALFLGSDLSTYVTGQVIGVDGGMVI